MNKANHFSIDIMHSSVSVQSTMYPGVCVIVIIMHIN